LKVEGCDFPDALSYSEDGLFWAQRRGGEVAVGITSVLGWLSGAFRSVTFKPPGTNVRRGASLGAVDGVRHFDVVRAPFDCTVVGTNGAVSASPRLLNTDPYGAGWFAQVRPTGSGWTPPTGEEAAVFLAEAVHRLGVRCFANFPDLEMFEVGVECSAVLTRLNEALAPTPGGTVVHLVTDDPTSDIEMERWSEESGNPVLETRGEGSLHHYIVRKA
jgi:glycine cleavage system H protein